MEERDQFWVKYNESLRKKINQGKEGNKSMNKLTESGKPMNLTGFNDLHCFVGMLIRARQQFEVHWFTEESETAAYVTLYEKVTFRFRLNGHLEKMEIL